ncbi:glutathione S-transferase family protein [Shewanella algae]|uniref:glutathione S-transferase family protein n=1 Tax=Shewanella algae TaxID=38313 RepID=UPI001C588D17|nr:glutathione S-transferase [Shewanella algae]
MKLYELGPTPSARRVSIFMAEKGIDIERVHVDLRGGENLSAEFKAKSLNGRIPLLELDDGSYLCESVAICRYLDELFPTELKLFGSTPLERAKVEMWQRIVELQGLLPAFQAFRNISGIYSDRETCIQAWGEESRKRLESFLPLLKQRLSESPYLAGDNYSIADITAYILLGFIKNLQISLQPFPVLQSWYEQTGQRPAMSQSKQG